MRRALPFRHPSHHRFAFITVASIVLAVIVGPVVLSDPGVSAGHTGAAVSGSTKIVVTTHQCAAGWSSRTAGATVFDIDDRTDRAGEIYLFNPFSGQTVVHTTMHPNAVVQLRVHLRAGRYRWNCALHGVSDLTSTEQAVRPAPVEGVAGPMVQISVAPHQMAGPIASYRAYVSQQLALDSGEVRLLQTDIAAGQVASARAAWVTAHLTWHRIGGAYDAFGNLGLSIDGTADRLQDGVASPQFTGFHKVEMDLWQTDDLSVAGTDATVLESDLNELAVQFPSESIPSTELPLRTHEILEDALRDELSGEDDYGSGTDMASVAADVDGTRELLSLLAPLLDARAPHLVATVTSQLNRLDGALAATQSNGQWVAVSQVPLDQSEKVDAAIGNALETLSLVPELLQIQGSTT
jgi:high-affinity iron transporter